MSGKKSCTNVDYIRLTSCKRTNDSPCLNRPLGKILSDGDFHDVQWNARSYGHDTIGDDKGAYNETKTQELI